LEHGLGEAEQPWDRRWKATSSKWKADDGEQNAGGERKTRTDGVGLVSFCGAKGCSGCARVDVDGSDWAAADSFLFFLAGSRVVSLSHSSSYSFFLHFFSFCLASIW
jgi:hypothetical protein